jgi:hypothetical protein
MRYLVVIAASLALVAVAGAQRTTLRSGLYGTVMRGPITPVCVAEAPCSAPAAGAVLVFTRGTVVDHVTVASDGTYRLHLPAGLYVVRTGKQRLDPTVARVYVGRMARLDFSIDTGIR